MGRGNKHVIGRVWNSIGMEQQGWKKRRKLWKKDDPGDWKTKPIYIFNRLWLIVKKFALARLVLIKWFH